VAVPICLPHITLDLTWVRTQVFEVRGPWLAMRFMTIPFSYEIIEQYNFEWRVLRNVCAFVDKLLCRCASWLKLKALQLDLRLGSAFKMYRLVLTSSKLILNFLCRPASDMTLVPLLEHNTHTHTHTRHRFMTADGSCSSHISNNLKFLPHRKARSGEN
jgi:hypothetical protein